MVSKHTLVQISSLLQIAVGGQLPGTFSIPIHDLPFMLDNENIGLYAPPTAIL